MKIPIPPWFKKASPKSAPLTLDELRRRLATGRAEHAAAVGLVTAARERMRSERTDETVDAWEAAKKQAERLAEFVSDCERDVAEAEEEQRKAERADLERQLSAFEARDAAAAKRGAELAEAFFQTFVASVTAWSEIREHDTARNAAWYDLAKVRSSLGKSTDPPPRTLRTAFWWDVAERLAGYAFAPEARRFALELARLLAPNARI